ncbi:MAG: hypothetical protein IKB60_00925 [Clostridia bacterium]|nr:hypothetical protein [Clostridia bacterium]
MKTYYAKKTNIDNVPIGSDEWEKAETILIDTPAPGSIYSPETKAWLLHSEKGLSLKMETDEKPLVTEVKERNGMVCEDSCLEFFIGTKEGGEYLNFEINPIKTLHLGFGPGRHGRTFPEIPDEAFDMDCSFENDKWQLKLFLSYEVIDEVFGSHTDVFYGNFYKCGDKTPKLHYLMWNPVETPEADFHLPEFFGKIVLEK